jgi:hypothetical protein
MHIRFRTLSVLTAFFVWSFVCLGSGSSVSCGQPTDAVRSRLSSWAFVVPEGFCCPVSRSARQLP